METTTPSINPGAGISSLVTTVTDAVNSNQGAIFGLAAGLLAVGIVWKFAKRFAK